MVYVARVAGIPHVRVGVPTFSHTLSAHRRGVVWPLRLLSFLLPLDRLLCSGHDVSDGGLITCLLEMAFAGNCGIKVDLPASGVDGEEPRVWAEAWAACPPPADPMSC